MNSQQQQSRLVVGVAVNDSLVLEQNLAASPVLADGTWTLLPITGATSAAKAYNSVLEQVTEPFVLLAHQDVYLPSGFEHRLASSIRLIEQMDPNWAVIGVIGLDDSGCVTGTVWSNGLQREVGSKISNMQRVTTIDELLIVVRSGSGLRFDEKLPGFHLYGTDIVLMAQEQRLNSYVVDAPVIHNSRAIRWLDASYAAGYRYMQQKWAHRLPVSTLIVPITHTFWPIYRARLSLVGRYLRSWRSRVQRRQWRSRVRRHPSVPTLAKELGYEFESTQSTAVRISESLESAANR